MELVEEFSITDSEVEKLAVKPNLEIEQKYKTSIKTCNILELRKNDRLT